MIIGNLPHLFYQNLRYLRRKNKMTYQQLSFAAGLDRELLRNMEQTGVPDEIDYQDLRMLCAVFDVKIEEILHKDLTAKQETTL